MNKIIIILVMGIFVVGIVPDAYLQTPTQQYIQRLENEGKFNCEVHQFNEFFYKPIRINMVHETVEKTDVSIESKDPESQIFWEASKQTFQLVTDSPDRFDVEIILDYSIKHEEPRNVFYQIYGLDNILMQEGNWVHEGFTFCLIFSFTTTDPPHILTSEEIQEENNAFNSQFRKEVALSNTSVQNALLLIGVVQLVVGTVVGLVFFVIIVSMRSMGKIGNKPVKKLNDMIENVRTTNDNLKLVSDHLIETDARTKNEIRNELHKTMLDASIVMFGARKIIEELAKATGIKNVLPPSPAKGKTETKKQVKSQAPSFVDTVVQRNTPEEEKVNEESQAEQYGVIISKTESEEHKTIEMDESEIKPCKICGEPPTAICGTCNEQFCNQHLNHGCDVKELKPKAEPIPSKEKVVMVTKKIKTVFFEERDPIVTDKGQIQKHLDRGMSEIRITSLLVKEYSKVGRNENLRRYGDMQKENAKKNSRELDIKLDAMLTTLNNQVN